MTDLATHLERLGLELYLDAFIAEGFDSWETLLDIQESDLDALGVKLGHRRKLQRAIADHRGISYERPLDPKQLDGYAGEVPLGEGQPADALAVNGPGGTAPPQEQKRKYRRHPKPDENAPEKPPSAYVLFSNKTREDVKEEHLTFTEIAKLVGERWQKLDPSEKEPYESHAQALKDSYHIQLSAYKKTDSYKNYMQYLAEFKLKHGQASDNKRPRLDPQSSGGSLSTTTSQDTSESITPGPSQARGGSLEAVGATTTHVDGLSALSSPTELTPTASLPNLAAASSGGLTLMTAPHSGSPPASQYGQDVRRVGQYPLQSTMVNDTGQLRNEISDPLARAATLSLNTPPALSPPPASNLPTALRLDPSVGPEPLTWPGSRHPPQTSTRSGSHGPGLAYAPPVAQELWRDRITDPPRPTLSPTVPSSGYPAPPPPPPPPPPPLTLAPLIAPSRLPDLTRVQAQRTLPPLQRQYPAGSAPHATYSPQHLVTPQNQLNPRSPPLIEHHDSEIAATLAALAKRSTTEQMGSPGESRR